MGPTIRSLVIPVSDLDAAKAIYTALLGSPHTDESYYVGYNINGFEVALNPAGRDGGPVAFADVERSSHPRDPVAAAATERDARCQVARRRGSGARDATATPSACAESSRHRQS